MEAKFRQKKKKVSYGKSSRDVLTEAALREERISHGGRRAIPTAVVNLH